MNVFILPVKISVDVKYQRATQRFLFLFPIHLTAYLTVVFFNSAILDKDKRIAILKCKISHSFWLVTVKTETLNIPKKD